MLITILQPTVKELSATILSIKKHLCDNLQYNQKVKKIYIKIIESKELL